MAAPRTLPDQVSSMLWPLRSGSAGKSFGHKDRKKGTARIGTLRLPMFLTYSGIWA